MTRTATITYALQFRGQVEYDGAHERATTRATSSMLVSVVDRDGPHGRFEGVGSGEAVFRVTLEGGDPVAGEVDFGGGTTLRLRTAEHHPAGRSANAYVRHGAALLEVMGGTGRLSGVRGLVTSNFLLSDTGDLTDTHLGLLFVERP